MRQFRWAGQLCTMRDDMQWVTEPEPIYEGNLELLTTHYRYDYSPADGDPASATFMRVANHVGATDVICENEPRGDAPPDVKF